MREPQHDTSCAEWCNHCEVCGVGILYGSRCPQHPNRTICTCHRDPDGTVYGSDYCPMQKGADRTNRSWT